MTIANRDLDQPSVLRHEQRVHLAAALVRGSLVKAVGGALQGNSNAVTESTADRVHHSSLVDVAGGEGDGSNKAQGSLELVLHEVVVDGQDLDAENGAVVVHLVDNHTVGEGLDGKLLQQGSLGVLHLVAGLDEVHLVGDLDLTLDNLGGDLQDLEERGLTGVAAGGTGGDGHVLGGEGADLGGGRDSVGQNHVTDLAQLGVGEHKADVALAQLNQGTDGVLGVGLQERSEDLAHEGVLAHQNLSSATHLHAGVLHLLGADVVNLDDEHLGVLAEQTLHSLEVEILLSLRERHFSF
jgi:hypothetical protein